MECLLAFHVYPHTSLTSILMLLLISSIIVKKNMHNHMNVLLCNKKQGIACMSLMQYILFISTQLSEARPGNFSKICIICKSYERNTELRMCMYIMYMTALFCPSTVEITLSDKSTNIFTGVENEDKIDTDGQNHNSQSHISSHFYVTTIVSTIQYSIKVHLVTLFFCSAG